MNVLKGRVEETEERISELENKTTDIYASEAKARKIYGNTKQSLRDLRKK